MTRRKRRNHSPAFKAKVALAAVRVPRVRGLESCMSRGAWLLPPSGNAVRTSTALGQVSSHFLPGRALKLWHDLLILVPIDL